MVIDCSIMCHCVLYLLYVWYAVTCCRTSSYSELQKKKSSGSSLSSLASCSHRSNRFDNLESLDLSDNKLKVIQFLNDSEEIEKGKSQSDTGGQLFPKLSYLDLSNNKLAKLPASIADHKELSQLLLSNNPLKEVSNWRFWVCLVWVCFV